jgi:2-polyprenyl-6-methoxyphenol hydroxylase-like FAD-dependent oxidoreductase
MVSFPSPDVDLDRRDLEAQKRLVRERMAGFGWETERILTHLDDAPDFYFDEVAQVVLDHWHVGRVGLIGDAAFCASPMSGAGTGLSLGGAYFLAGELAAADWDPAVGFAAYRERMRDYVEANQELGRMHVEMLTADPGARPVEEPDMEAIGALIERGVTGPTLPDYADLPDARRD